jgi:Fe-S-cluster-containing dehydrogenase component
VATVSGALAFRGVQSGDPIPPQTAKPEDESVGVLIDLTRCTGCESCVLACKQSNHMPTPEIAGTALDCENLTCVQA